MASQGQRFRRQALRRGYKVDEVDAFLDRVEATLDGEPVGAPVAAQEVHDVVFRVRFGGYDEWQVDLHLDRVERQLAELEERGGAGRPAAADDRLRSAGPDGPADARRPRRAWRPQPDAAPADAGAGRPARRSLRPVRRADRRLRRRVRRPARVATTRRAAGSVRRARWAAGGPMGRGTAPPHRGLPAGPAGYGAARRAADARPAVRPARRPARRRRRTARPTAGAARRLRPARAATPRRLSDGRLRGRAGTVATDMTAEIRMPERDLRDHRGRGPAGPTRACRAPGIGGPPMAGRGPPMAGPPMGWPGPMVGPPMAGPPGSDLHRVDQIRRSFQARRFGSGYDPDQVDRLFESILGGMPGRDPMPVDPKRPGHAAVRPGARRLLRGRGRRRAQEVQDILFGADTAATTTRARPRSGRALGVRRRCRRRRQERRPLRRSTASPITIDQQQRGQADQPDVLDAALVVAAEHQPAAPARTATAPIRAGLAVPGLVLVGRGYRLASCHCRSFPRDRISG